MTRRRVNVELKQINKLDVPYNLSIDTMYLVAQLNHEQYEFVNERVKFRVNEIKDYHKEESQFHYIVNHKNITILASPKNHFANAHYNVMIIFKKRTSKIYIPYSIKEILQFDCWKFKRIDLSFDVASRFENRFLAGERANMKFDDLSKEEHIKTDYFDNYTVSLYDQNEKEKDRGTDIEHELATRCEVKLYPTLNKFNNLQMVDHGWIKQQLARYIFIPDIEQLPVDGYDKRRLRNMMRDKNHDYLKTYKGKKLKKVLSNNKMKLEDIYNEFKDNLYSFLNIEPLHIDLESTHGEVLDTLGQTHDIDSILLPLENVPDFVRDVYDYCEITNV